jgi:integrase
MPKYRRGSGSVYLKRDWCYIKYYVNGNAVTEATGTKNKAEARRILQARLGQIAEGRYVGPAAERVTFEELVEMILDDYRVNGRKSRSDVEWRIRCHLWPFFNQKRAHEITMADVKAYIAHRQEEGAKNGSINRELAALKRMFNLALQTERIIKKPYIPSLEENNARKGFFEQAEYEAVLAKLSEHLRPVVTFAHATGWRIRSEVLPLTWSQVDMETGTVRLEVGETKNKDGRLIYLTAELRSLLAIQWQDHALFPQCPWVFHDHGKRLKTFYKNWRKACQAAGLPGKLGHDFRRTAVRNMVRAGIPERVAMQMSGHKTRSIFDRYHIVADGDLKEAARRLDHAFTPQTATTLATLPLSTVERVAVTH